MIQPHIPAGAYVPTAAELCPYYENGNCRLATDKRKPLNLPEDSFYQPAMCDGLNHVIDFELNSRKKTLGCGRVVLILSLCVTNENKVHLLTIQDEFIRQTVKKIVEKLASEDLEDNSERVEILRRDDTTTSPTEELLKLIERFG